MDEKKEIFKGHYFKQGIMFFLVGLALVISYYLINNVHVVVNGFDRINDILMPFYMGLVIAYLMCPTYNQVTKLVFGYTGEKFSKKKNALMFSKVIATLVSLAVIIFVIVGFFMLIIPSLWESIVTIITTLPETSDKAISWIHAHMEENPDLRVLLTDKLGTYANAAIDWAQEKLVPGAEAVISNLSIGLIETVKGVFDFFIALIICVYVLNSKEKFIAQSKKLILSVFKKEKAEKFFELGTLSNETFGGFINGKIIDSIIIGIICFFAMSILGIPLVTLISVIIGVTNIIPFFGPFIGAIPSILILVIISPIDALKFAVMVLVLQQVDGNIIGPKILGKTTKLASFWVMFAIIVSGGLFGFAGMVLGVPFFAILYTYISRGVNGRLKKKDMPTDTLVYEDFSKYNINKEAVFGQKGNNDNKEDGGGAPGEK